MVNKDYREPNPSLCRWTWAWAALTTLGLFGLYVWTAAPTIHSGDTAELATAGLTFGIAHPPGYALFSLLNNLFGRLLPLGDPAWRLNLLSAGYGAGAAGFLLLTLASWGAPPLAGLAAALSLGCGATVWSQATVCEVYAFDLFLLSTALWLASRTGRPQSGGRGQALFAVHGWQLTALLAGAWVAHRTVNLIYLPVLALLAWPGLWRGTRGPTHALGRWFGLILLFCLPFLTWLYLPLASMTDPLLDTGDPQSWTRFVQVVTARVYRIYFFTRDPWLNLSEVFGELPRDLGLALVLTLPGLVGFWRRRRRVVLAVGALLLANLVFVASYGVPDRAVFALPSVFALAMLAGLGAATILAALRGTRLARISHQPSTAASKSTASSRPSPSAHPHQPSRLPSAGFGPRSSNLLHFSLPRDDVGENSRLAGAKMLAAAALLVACVAPLAWLNLPERRLSDQTLARDFARDSLAMAGKNGVLLSHVDTVSFSLWYAQAVEGRRPDLLVLSRGRAVDWHQEQARRLRPDLDIPLYSGPDPAVIWPATVLRRNVNRVPIYLTANLPGSFGPKLAERLSREVRATPAGLLTRLSPIKKTGQHHVIIKENVRFWQQAWPHAVRARAQRLNTDLTAVLLHYASMRLLFARYCLLAGDAAAAERSAKAVVGLNTAPLVAQVNRAFGRMGARYHMSELPAMAQKTVGLAQALDRGAITAQQLRRGLSAGAAPSMPDVGSGGAADPDRMNMEGIRLAQAGRLSQAMALFERVLQHNPAHVGALFNQAKVLALTGQTAAAREAYEVLLKRSPDHLPGLAGLAELVAPTDREAAKGLLRRALNAPGPPSIKDQIRRRLRQLSR